MKTLKLINTLARKQTLWLALALLATLTLGVRVLPRAVAAVNPDPVVAAWQRAQASGSYHFASDVVQQTIPSATVANVGRTSHSDKLRLEGQADLRRSALELRLWSDGGSVLQDSSGVGVRMENGKTWVRQGAGEWKQAEGVTDAVAPQGDFMAYLQAVRDVQAHEPETRAGIAFTRYSFRIDGPTWAAYMRDQLAAAMRQKGELPPGTQLDVPAYYRDMTGAGELWVGQDGLPLRQILDLQFPEQRDERVTAHISVDFSQFGPSASAAAGAFGLLDTLQQHLPAPESLPGVFLALVFAGALVRFRHSRRLYAGIVVVVIASMVAGPLLNDLKISSFLQAQTASAAERDAQRAQVDTQRDMQTTMASSNFDPHANPLVTGPQPQLASGQAVARGLQAPSPNRSAAPGTPVVDNGADTDKDGLSDFTEVRIGTSEVISDTDDDGLTDNLEVNGFALGGQTWYTDPNVTDSNNDGQGDILEWGIDSSTGLPQATPRDTDGDGLPDLFDPDNDNDGVPDRVDAAPFAKGAATYNEATPLQLTISNLAAGKPAFVDFQIRPTDPKNLWFAYNVLDWPQDSEGQVRDVDGKTYADVAHATGRAADASDANGDMKLVPMLEIRIPTASANLPSQAELTPFNISVNDFSADGATKVAYVPLTIVTDPLTGERVAFSGQMRYKPTGSWATPHSVRLAWVVQALNDLPCDPKAANAAAQGCQSDGYIHNYPSLLHSYYDNWTLAGLSVREDNGASMAIVYEDPAVDPNKKDEAPLWGLTDALSEHFLKPQDANNDGARDLKLSDFPARFDRDNNPGDAQRFSVPNILQVASADYATSDEAAMTTAMTETAKILNTAFKGSVQADNAIKPLLLFAQESRVRAVGLDQLVASEGYATQNGTTISLNLAPTADKALPVTTQASLKWQAYCGASGNTVAWRPCTSDEYAGVIEGRYANAPALPDDTDPAEVPGRMMLALAYYSTLAGGYQAQVQEGTAIASSRYSLEGESDTATRLRIGFNSVTQLPTIVMQNLIHLFYASKQTDFRAVTVVAQIKATIKTLGLSQYQMKVDAATAEAKIIDFDASNPEGTTKVTAKLIRAQKISPAGRFSISLARYAAAAPIGSAIMLVTQVLSQLPDFDTQTRTALGAVSALVTAGVTIYIPAATVADTFKHAVDAPNSSKVKPSLAKILNASTLKTAAVKTTFAVGLVVNVALIWGFFAYAAGTSGLAAGSPELNKAAAQAIASTVIAVLFAVLSATFIGTIIVGIVTVIDLIFNLICELGGDQLRVQGGFYGGACFSISTTVTKALAYLLYNYAPMIDTGRSDLMVTGAPDVALADPSKGYVPANSLNLSLPVTTTVVHKNPDPGDGLYINGYLWLFSPDNLRSSTFKYGLTTGKAPSLPVDLGQMKGAWQDVREDHKYVATPMYRGVARTDPAPFSGLPLTQGINSSVPFSLTMSFAVPAYECWPMWIPLTPIVFPVCYTRDLKNVTTTPINVLKYDVFPNTLAEFVALGPKADGGQGQTWDAKIGSLRDADGDGLVSAAFNGLDPNDNTWDSDGDGLSDRFELDQRAAGNAYSPLLRDTDGDGLSDKQEFEISTDPANADTDNDGLPDGAEVRHQVMGANGMLTTTWAGGWQVTLNTTPARTVWVSSDPFNADGDGDGISDQAEKELAANPDATLRVDDQGMPYNPNVANTPPLAVFTDSSALFGYVGPNETLAYTTTVVANVPVAPGVLSVTAPAVLGGSPNPAALPFDPLSFTGAQTVTQQSTFAVPANAGTQGVLLNSAVNTRLPNSGADWAWNTPTAEAALGTSGRTSAFISGAAAQPDRQDSYRLIGQSVLTSTTALIPGNVSAYDIPSGTVRNLEVDPANPASRGNTSPAIACNDLGFCLAAWGEVPANLPMRIGATLFAPDGTVRSTFAVSTPPTTFSMPVIGPGSDSAPVVASDGSKFLVAWQRLTPYDRPLTATDSTISFQTELMTRLYDGSGNPLTAETTLASDGLEFWSANINTTSALNGARSRLNRIDLDWVGDRYRLTRGISLGNAANDPNVSFRDNGARGSTRQLTWRDINDAGALIAGSKALVYNDDDNDANASHSLVYNPSLRHVLLIRTRGSQVVGQTFSTSGALISGIIPIAQSAANAVAAYYPPTQGFLIGWTDTSTAGRPFRYQALDPYYQQLGTDQQELTWPVAVDSTRGTALACPAPLSAPVVDLRFEELPGATTFADSSGNNNNATSSGASAPAAGFAGAPNAPRSDYAAQFDGVDDKLLVQTNAPSSFSAALWVKTAPGSTSGSTLIDHGFSLLNGWNVGLVSGKPILGISYEPGASTSKRVDDGAWHFVVATRNGITGASALYVDGALEGSGGTVPSPRVFNAVSTISIGNAQGTFTPFKGQLDQVQLYRTVLSASTVQALYNRTLQSYCVAAAVPSSGTDFPWTRLSYAKQDTRGGRLAASASLRVSIDADKPTAALAGLTNNTVIGPDQVIGGNANDTGVGVALVQVSVNNGEWKLAAGANTWSFSLAGLSGAVSVRTRAVDLVGNVGDASAPVNVTIDTTPPTLTQAPPAGTIKPAKNANGRWQVTLNGTASDAAGIKPNSTLVLLQQQSGVGLPQTQQTATLSGNAWRVDYLLDPALADPTGAYTVTAQTEDTVGNRVTAPSAVVRLDTSGPIAALDNVASIPTVITQTLSLSGLVTDTNSIAGLKELEIAFTPIEQVAALPVGITSDGAEALLKRAWAPVTLAQRGAGKATSAWSYAVPAGLEGSYQIDLRGTDLLGNQSISSNVWSGLVDTRDPRVVMSATASGASYFDGATNQQLYEIRFVCAAVDRYLTEASFSCPGKGQAEPTRSFETIPALQSLFPDLTVRSGLAISYTAWLPTLTPVASARACDTYGRCAQASTPSAAARAAAVASLAAAPAPGAPKALVVAPTNGSVVAANTALGVSVAAEAGAALKTVAVSLDNTVVQTLSFAQSENVTRTLRTINLATPSEGSHALVVRATDWAGATQSTLYPVAFTLDTQAPSVTIDASALTPSDTWQQGSGVLRFKGSASDSVGLAAVQVREGSGPFVDATFGNGSWHAALLVQDPEGRTLSITVRATDKAGRIAEATQSIATSLSAPDAPDTTLVSGPANPSATNTASFAFNGSASAVTFECQLDTGSYQPCASPQQYTDLAKGSHTVRVRAIDSRGFVDLSPATYSWAVSASQPDATISAKPASPTTERSASFTFTGGVGATRFECALDGAAWAACASPKQYSGLGVGDHTFAVRARDAANKAGAADRALWTIANDVPVAASQSVTVVANQAKAITLTASDNDALAYTIVVQPAHGALVGVAPNLLYVPNTGFGGVDSFSFRASDGTATSNLATVTLLLDNIPPVVSVTGVTNGATYLMSTVPAAACSTTDALSGVANVATLTITGGSIAGTGTFTATCAGATDKAGNVAPAVSVSYRVASAVIVRGAPTLNSGARVEGPLWLLTGENATLNGTTLTGDLLVPGSPSVVRNSGATLGATVSGSGSAQPSGYRITLNSGTNVNRLVTRTDPIALPAVAAPPAPRGTRDVAINQPGQSIGDPTTLRNLTLSSNAGAVTVPAGTYGQWAANSNSRFVLGVAGATQPSVYNLQSLTLNSGGRLDVVGPVILNLGNGLSLNSTSGTSARPDWLLVNVAAGAVQFNSGSAFYGTLRAPSSTVTLNSGSRLEGAIVADRLTLNGSVVHTTP